jgi:hypothetical protein
VKHRIAFSNLLLLLSVLALSPTALASTTWYVNGVNGNNNNNCKTPQTACKTIRHAISLAHSGDSIKVAAATYTENLTIGLSLKVIGSGASTTIIDGGGSNTFKSVVGINTGAHVTLSRVTIRNGNAFLRVGGGIANSGTLTINNSTISGNYANAGGGVFTELGTVTINNSTISGNYAHAGSGIYNFSTVTINNSTISGNGANLYGNIVNSGTLAISSSTISGGGFVISGGSVTLRGSIVT